MPSTTLGDDPGHLGGGAGARAGPAPSEAALADADAFATRFGQVYLRFHRRDGKRSQLGGGARGVLQHLALAGPLTVSEAARHLDRAQSVVSEIVTHLEHKGLLEREADPSDRRRTLIWLTEAGHEALRRDREVLSRDLLARALDAVPPDRRAVLLQTLTELLDAEASTAHTPLDLEEQP